MVGSLWLLGESCSEGQRSGGPEEKGGGERERMGLKRSAGVRCGCSVSIDCLYERGSVFGGNADCDIYIVGLPHIFIATRYGTSTVSDVPNVPHSSPQTGTSYFFQMDHQSVPIALINVMFVNYQSRKKLS